MMEKKKVLLLAVSCKKGGLCPGGLDLDDPRKWIRIVADDGKAGAVQGCEIDFANPLDVIEFEGRPMPQGKQQENWVIDNNSCKKIRSEKDSILDWAYQKYSYHGFWKNYKPYLTEEEFNNVDEPSESIMKVSNVKIYNNNFGKSKIDFDWTGARYRINGISMTDQDFYDKIRDGRVVNIEKAYIITAIPKYAEWEGSDGISKAYKFVSRIFPIEKEYDRIFNVKVVGGASGIMTKPDGSTYVLQKCKILDQGKLEGFVVSCQRMLINSKGEEKSPFEVGAKAVAYMQIVDDFRGKLTLSFVLDEVSYI